MAVGPAHMGGRVARAAELLVAHAIPHRASVDPHGVVRGVARVVRISRGPVPAGVTLGVLQPLRLRPSRDAGAVPGVRRTCHCRQRPTRSMKHRLFTVLAAVSLILLVALLALWVRSRSVIDYAQWTDHRHFPGLVSSDGRII